jgi:hypothetical protein
MTTLDCDNPDDLESAAAYVRARLRDVDELRRRVTATKHLGAALTGDMIARNRQAVASVTPRNPSPPMDELVLTFLDQPELVAEVDGLLAELRAGFGTRMNDFRQYVRALQHQPLPHLFELNVHAALRRQFVVVPGPRLTHGKVGDFRLDLATGQQVFVEATVLRESRQEREFLDRMMREKRKHWTGSKDLHEDVVRLARKLDEKLQQTEAGKPNIILVSIRGCEAPTSWFVQTTQEFLARDYREFRDYVPVNGDRSSYLDSVGICGSRGVRAWVLNPHAAKSSQLDDRTRLAIQDALAASEFIRRA